MTITEILRAQGIEPGTINMAKGVTDYPYGQMAGNAMSLNVLTAISKKLFQVMSWHDGEGQNTQPQQHDIRARHETTTIRETDGTSNAKSHQGGYSQSDQERHPHRLSSRVDRSSGSEGNHHERSANGG